MKHISEPVGGPDTAELSPYRLALSLQASGRPEEALAHAKQAVWANPASSDALQLLGQCFLQLGRQEDCITILTALLESNPTDVMALNNRGVAHDQLGKYQEALTDFEQACALDPVYADALINQASCLEKLQRFEESATVYEKLWDSASLGAAAHYGWANAQAGLGQWDAAKAGYWRALELDPDLGLAWYNLGLLSLNNKDYSTAVDAFSRAGQLLPASASSWNNCGNAYNALHDYESALGCYAKAIAANPDLAEAHFNRALVLNKMGRALEAIASIDHAIRIQPEVAQNFNVKGVALVAAKQPHAALEAFRKAIALNANFVDAYVNLANAHELLLQHEEAIECYGKALDLDPNYPYLESRLIYKKLYICQWDQSLDSLPAMLEKVANQSKVCDPFRIIALTDSAEIHKRVSECWQVAHPCPPHHQKPITSHGRHSKVRLGYFSADFHNHATAHLMAGLFEAHDRSQFELYAFSFGPVNPDEIRYRLEASFDHFLEVGHLSDEEIAALSRELEIDIAMDLKGFTFDNRMNIFKMRAAPIQINYLGYPGTAGSDCFDYIIADPIIIPTSLASHYTEKVLHTSGSYQCNDQAQPLHDADRPDRIALGLPATGFIFCSFNNNYKIRPEIFDIWMNILRAVDGSVLWLMADSDTSKKNLQQEAVARGVDPKRIVFAGRTSHDEHLHRQRAADLFLDTFPCSAHTTASDALRSGVPVLTITGESFASRVASSINHFSGVPQLNCTSLAEYQDRAIELAKDTNLITKLKQNLNPASNSLFDTRVFCKDYERLLLSVYHQHHQELEANP